MPNQFGGGIEDQTWMVSLISSYSHPIPGYKTASTAGWNPPAKRDQLWAQEHQAKLRAVDAVRGANESEGKVRTKV